MQTRLYFNPVNDKQSGARAPPSPFVDLPCPLSESPYDSAGSAAWFASVVWYSREMMEVHDRARERVSMSGALLASAMLSACGGANPPPIISSAATPAPVPAPVAPRTSWNGQWNGPEGTFLRIEGDAAGYRITIRNLDGPRTFTGSAANAQIQFERDGVMEVIHATNGIDTGMKWLADKSDCLTVRTGEGYCRD